MAKKRSSKSKTQMPIQPAMGIDYGNSLRFLFAGVTDADWRDAIGQGTEEQIRAALTSVGISFPNPAHFDAVVVACQNLQALTGAWNLFDNLRAALLGPGAHGAA